jgi:hypothetical protein
MAHSTKRKKSRTLGTDLTALGPSKVALIVLAAIALISGILSRVVGVGNCYWRDPYCGSNLFLSIAVFTIALATIAAGYEWRAQISRLLNPLKSFIPVKNAKRPPTDSEAFSATFLSVIAYLFSVGAATMAMANANDVSNSWGGACGQLPTVVDHIGQYSLIAICAAVVGLLISLTYAPKSIRFIGLLVLAASIFVYWGSGFTAHFHLCF